jgi:hypothetical protein
MQKCKYLVVGANGEYYEKKNDTELYYFIKKVGIHNIGCNWNDSYRDFSPFEGYTYIGHYIRRNVYWLVLFNDNRIVSREHLVAVYEFGPIESERRNIRPYWRWYRRDVNYLGFRNGPVPYTGKGSGYNYHRNIRTTNERRQSLSCDREYVRSKRNHKNIPNTWDDIPRKDIHSRSWKNNKKRKQWMK